MFRIIKNLSGRRYLWAFVVVSGGLIGLGTLAGQAQAADYRTNWGRPATTYVAPTNLNASAAQINRNLQLNYDRQHMPGWDWQRTYPYSAYNLYNPYNIYSPYNAWNTPYYNPYYGSYYPYYNSVPNVVYPYVSPYAIP
jgi:hypothetical protein